jgi:hypothetical protein
MTKRYKFTVNGEVKYRNVSPEKEQAFFDKYGQYNPIIVTDEPGKQESSSAKPENVIENQSIVQPTGQQSTEEIDLSQNNQQQDTGLNLGDGSSESLLKEKSNLEKAEIRVSDNQPLPSDYEVKASQEYLDKISGPMPEITSDLTSQKEDPAFDILQDNYIQYGFNFDKSFDGVSEIIVHSSMDLDGDGVNDFKEFSFNDADSATEMDKWMRSRALNPKERFLVIHDLAQPKDEQLSNIPTYLSNAKNVIQSVRDAWGLDERWNDTQVIQEYQAHIQRHADIQDFAVDTGGGFGGIISEQLEKEQAEAEGREVKERHGDLVAWNNKNNLLKEFWPEGVEFEGTYGIAHKNKKDTDILIEAQNEYILNEALKEYNRQTGVSISNIHHEEGGYTQHGADILNSKEYQIIKQNLVIDEDSFNTYVNRKFERSYITEFYENNIGAEAAKMGDSFFFKSATQKEIESEIVTYSEELSNKVNKINITYEKYETSVNRLLDLNKDLNNNYTTDLVNNRVEELKSVYNIRTDQEIKQEVERIKSLYNLNTQEGVDKANEAIKLLQQEEKNKIDSLNQDEYFTLYKEKINQFNYLKDEILPIQEELLKKYEQEISTLEISESELATLASVFDQNHQLGTVLAQTLKHSIIDLFQTTVIDVGDMIISFPSNVVDDLTNNNPVVDAYLKTQPIIKTRKQIYEDKSLLAKWSQDINEWQEEDKKTFRKSIAFGEISNGWEAGEWALTTLVQQAPQLATLYFTGGASLYVLGASSAGSKWRELNDQKDLYLQTGGFHGQNYSFANMYANAIFTGTMEGLSEKITLGQVNRLRGFVGSNWKLGFKNGIKKNFFSYSGLKKNGGIYLKDGFNEGFSEVVAQLSSNAADIVSGSEEVNIWDGIPESFFSGWVVSTGLKIPSVAKRLTAPFRSKDTNQKLGEIATEIQSLTRKLGNLDISPIERSNIESKIALLTQRSNNILQTDIKRIDLLSDKDKKALVNIEKRNFEARKEAEKTMLNNKLTSKQKKAAIKKLQNSVDTRDKAKDAILSKLPPGTVDRHYKNKIQTMRTMAELAEQHGAPKVEIEEVSGKEMAKKRSKHEQNMSAGRVSKIAKRNEGVIKAMEAIIADPKSTKAEVADAKAKLKDAKQQVSIAYNLLRSDTNGVMQATFDKKGNIASIKILLNKDAMIKNGRINTAAHEFIHAVFANTLKFDPQMREILGNKLIDILTNDKNVSFKSDMARRTFIKRVSVYSKEKQGEEMLAIAAEMLIDGDIIIKKPGLKRLAKLFNDFVLRMFGYDLKWGREIEVDEISFDTAEDIKQFLILYRDSIINNKPSAAIAKMLAKGANGKMFEDAKNPDERKNISMESKAVEVALDNNEDLMFNKNKTGFDDIIWNTTFNEDQWVKEDLKYKNDEEFKVSQGFWSGYSKIVDTKDLDGIIMSHVHEGTPLYDVIQPTKGLSKKQAIDRFIRQVKERAGEKYISEFSIDKLKEKYGENADISLFGWLTGSGGGQGKSIIYRSRGDVMNKMKQEPDAFGFSLDTTVTEETGTTRADMIEDTKSEYISRLEKADLSVNAKKESTETIEKLSMVMDSIDIPSDIKDAVRTIVRTSNVPLTDLTYKGIRDLLLSIEGKATSEKNIIPTGPLFEVLNSISAEFGVDPLRILAKQDLNAEQRQSAQTYIFDKAVNEDGSFNTSLLEALPEGQDRDGKATGVANTKLGQLYTKGERAKYKQGATAAGLATQNKRTDITKEEFLSLFGINPDGSFQPGTKADGAIRELVVQIAQLAANQEIRLNAIDNTLEKSSIIAKLGDGKSESMFSEEGNKSSLIKNDYQMTAKDIANLLEQRLIPGSGENKRLGEMYNKKETFAQARDRIIIKFSKQFPQLRYILALGLTGGPRSTAKTMEHFESLVEPIEGERRDVRTQYTDKGILTLPTKTIEDADGNKIKVDVNSKEFYEIELNKLAILKELFLAIQEYINTNPKDTWLFLEMLRDSGAAGQNHVIRRLAPFLFYPVNPKDDSPVKNTKIREEHTDPQNQVGTGLMMAAIRGNVNEVFDTVIGQSYMQGGLIMKHDDMVNDAGYKNTMPNIYFKLVIPRLKSGELKLNPGMSSVIRMAVSGVDLNNSMLVGFNQTIVEYFGLPRIRNASQDVVEAQNQLITMNLAGQIESMDDAVAEFNDKYLSLNPNGNTLASESKNFEDNEINMSNSINLVSLSLSQNNSLLSLEPPKVKGMSTFDFDDTLARTKSGVRYRIPNETGEPAPGRKVIFLAGSAGSGKSNVVEKLGLKEKGFKIVNQDISLEWLVKNSGLPTDMRDFTPEQASKWGSLQWEARDIAQRKRMKFQGRGDGIVVDGTGASAISMGTQAMRFRNAGYDVHMLFVDSSLETSLERNRARKERSLKDFIVERNWKAVQENKKVFKEDFGNNFTEVNTDNLKQEDPMPNELVDKINEFTDGYIKGRLTAEEFASQGSELRDKGAEFDFSEFNKVVDGTPGPLLDKARNRAKKFGTKDMFVLTARPQASAVAIHEFLKSQGLNIPLENITGLANSTGEAKAQWMLDKFAEGYNDMYFVDDAMQNVAAVRDVLNQLDIKSKVVQAKLKQVDRLVETNSITMESKVVNPKTEKRLDNKFNQMIERRKGVKFEKVFSAAEARKRGSQSNIVRFLKSLYIPPSAEDFKGLLYYFLGSGKQGEADMKFFADKLITPFAKGIKAWNIYKQNMVDEYKALKKRIPSVGKQLNAKVLGTNFTNDTAIRVYLWTKAGFEIPGISKRLQNKLVKHVNNNPDLKLFADSLSKISRRKDGYIQPSENWMMETIPTDLRNIVERVGRKEFLSEWINNKNIIFSQKNLNKIEALYGARFLEALENILYRMENGTNRVYSKDGDVNWFTNWINSSVGAIMFFNMRSALLQTISTVNFINWSDNNIFKASAAFANQDQFWKDFSMLFNSPQLKQRRRGLQTDVSASELTKTFAENGYTPQTLINYLLQIGFTPTQIADSFAIAFGGASFYRNRYNKYVRQGMSPKRAHNRTMLEFQEIAEETQQSSREDLISQQQASPLGRIILAFQNVTMQYGRLTKKALSDIVNGRGDMKTNVSKVIYYGAVQNIIFASLQSALAFIMWGDDEEEIEKKTTRTFNSVLDSFLRGTGLYGALVSTLKNTVIQWNLQKDKPWGKERIEKIALEVINLSPPIGSKVRKIVNAYYADSWNEGVSEELGWRIENPKVSMWANIVEAVFNIPLARIQSKANNLEEAITGDHDTWKKVAMLFGWNYWNLGVEDEELEEAKDRAEEKNKEEKKEEKEKEKEEEKKAEEEEKKKKGIKTVQCSGVNSAGQRCGMTTETAAKTWKCMHHMNFTDGMDRDGDGAKEYRCTATKTNGKRCKNKTENKNKRCYAHQ